VYWCSAWYALQSVFAFIASAFQDGMVSSFALIVFGGFCAYAALGLLRALKPAWHIAAFLAFLSIILTAITVACAPGDIVDDEKHLLEAALDVVMLAVFVLVYSWLRKPAVRTLYGVPESYAPERGRENSSGD